MAVRGTWLLSCLLWAGVAHAGSAPADLDCLSDSGKVALKGVIPSPSSDELKVELRYADGSLGFDSDTNASFAVTDFPQSVFTLVVAADGLPLTLYALPSSVAVTKRGNDEMAGKFQAKLAAPRPGSVSGIQSTAPLKATLNCEYRYAL
ncbi:hypothetical protein [Achromobacter agilis]|uniref:Fimbrial-type adhesion domain-containing protein n=1 Tax=Achromobacter agilis TaxID=1353888 RepID=A0A446C1Z1_9BURK|nr:hypothetical protein [Achromobacter agilis]SSW61767.1 hypothetical protein AGI3411_00068 [Achromobacter agilis]